MKKQLFSLLRAQAIADREKAITTLTLLSEYPAGIGDHSTGDFYKNAEEALTMLVDADDKISTLEKYEINFEKK
jgi:hypothetical protein